MAFGEYFNGFSQIGRGLIDELDRAEQKSTLSKLGDQLQTGDYSGAAGTAFKAGDLQTGINLLKLGQGQLQATQANERFNGLADLYGGGLSGLGGGFGVSGPVGGLGAAPKAPAPAGPTFASSGGALGDYLASTRARESAGNDAARNPNSTATGRYQFTADTWAGLAKKYPDLGLTPGGRTDPAQQERAMQRFTADNADYLSSKGLPITPGNLYGAHFLGAGGAASFIPRAINNPDAPAAAFAPSAAASNRNVFYNRDGSPKTAGEVYSWFGGQGGGVRTAAPQRVASADPSFAPSAPSPLSRPLQLNPSLQAPQGAGQQATDGGGDVDAYLTRSGLPVNAATRGAIGLLGPEAGRRFISNTLANPQAPTVSNLDEGVAQAHPELFLNADGSPRSSSQAFGLIGRQQVQGGFGRPGPSGLNPGRPIAVANNEADTQRLEQQMGMVPAGSAPNPQADMPVANAQPAEFRIPPGPQQAIPGSIASLPAGPSSPQPRGPLQEAPRPFPSSDVNAPTGAPRTAPALPDADDGASPARVMTMPGQDGPAPTPQARAQMSAQAPQIMAQVGVPPQMVAPLAQMDPGSGRKIQYLIRLSGMPGLDQAQRSTVSTLLHNELEQTKLPDGVKEFMWARSQGMTQAPNPAAYAREKQRNPGEDLTSQIDARAAAAQRFGMDPNSTEFRNYTLGSRPERDPGSDLQAQIRAREQEGIRLGMVPGSAELQNYALGNRPANERQTPAEKIASETAARRAAAVSQGLNPDDPRIRDFIISGNLPKENQQQLTAGDRKAINDAEDHALLLDQTLGTLALAKELNTQTYTGTGAGVLGRTGTSFPGAGLILDPKKAEATREFNQIMSMEAIKSMSSTLKGATTDREMDRFVEILGDPATPPDIRGRTLDRMMTLAQRQKDLAQARIGQMREGTYYRPGGGASAGASPQAAAAGGQSGAPALPPPSPSNRPGAVSPADRFGQLMGSGLSKQQAYQQLQKEGY